MEKTTTKVFITRSLIELLIIVAGVLLALAADDWWTEREERIEEAEILRAINEDLDSTTEQLQNSITRHTQVIDNIQTLSGGSLGSARDLESDAFQTTLWNALWDTPGFRVQMSAYEEIKHSGRMRLLRDPGLRRALATFDRLHQRAIASKDDAFQHQTSKLDPYLIEHYQLSQLALISVRDFEGAIPLEELPVTLDHAAMIDDRLFQNMIRSKYILVLGANRTLRELQETVTELKSLVQQRLDTLEN